MHKKKKKKMHEMDEMKMVNYALKKTFHLTFIGCQVWKLDSTTANGNDSRYLIIKLLGKLHLKYDYLNRCEHCNYEYAELKEKLLELSLRFNLCPSNTIETMLLYNGKWTKTIELETKSGGIYIIKIQGHITMYCSE